MAEIVFPRQEGGGDVSRFVDRKTTSSEGFFAQIDQREPRTLVARPTYGAYAVGGQMFLVAEGRAIYEKGTP